LEGGKTPPYSTTRQRLPLRGAPAARRVKGGPWGRNQHPATLQSPSVTASLKGSLLGPRVRRADMESAPTPTKIWPRRGQCGGRRKSVKKNAALLHFLAFSLTDHLFGVPRGEQPLGRGSLPRNSETFFVSFFGHKKGKPNGRMTLTRAERRKVARSGSRNLYLNKLVKFSISSPAFGIISTRVHIQ